MQQISPRLSLYSLLISSKYIPRVNLIFNIIQNGVITIGHDGIAEGLKLFEVIHHLAAKECGSILQRRFIYYHRRTLSFNTLHDTLNGTLTKVIGITLHRQTINADGNLFFPLLIVSTLVGVIIISCLSKNTSPASFHRK